jgi:hypothetical protein
MALVHEVKIPLSLSRCAQSATLAKSSRTLKRRKRKEPE